ncbi:transposase [Deinococcus ruber]|uniref:transposase n=1 Tax=Deinococcus ruber TaxID=1848197 RepID=UPI0035712B3B
MQLLAVGALLSPGKRTVTAALRVLGLADDPRFDTFHRLLNRARWSSLQASRVLLGLLLTAFMLSGPLVLGLDDTVERRTGVKISAKDLPRPRQIQSRALCESQWSALAESDAADAHPLGPSRLGVSVPDSVGAVTALQRSARSPTQNLDRLGSSDAARGASVVSIDTCINRRRLACGESAG